MQTGDISRPVLDAVDYARRVLEEQDARYNEALDKLEVCMQCVRIHIYTHTHTPVEMHEHAQLHTLTMYGTGTSRHCAGWRCAGRAHTQWQEDTQRASACVRARTHTHIHHSAQACTLSGCMQCPLDLYTLCMWVPFHIFRAHRRLYMCIHSFPCRTRTSAHATSISASSAQTSTGACCTLSTWIRCSWHTMQGI